MKVSTIKKKLIISMLLALIILKSEIIINAWDELMVHDSVYVDSIQLIYDSPVKKMLNEEIEKIENLKKMEEFKRRIASENQSPTRGNNKRIKVNASAYTLAFDECGKKPDHPAYGITTSGNKAKKWHTIATDWKVIPEGSVVYIEYFKDMPNKGIFISEDTGGAIKGNKIDIYFGDPEIDKDAKKKALEFGRKRNFEIEIIKLGVSK